MYSKGLILLAGMAIGAGGFAVSDRNVVATTTSAEAAPAAALATRERFRDVFNAVLSDYVEAPDPTALIEGALKGMVSSLDPHSDYMNGKDLENFKVTTSGRFGGIGLEVTTAGDLVKVVSPIDGTPAARAGLLANDLIVAIDGKDVHGMKLSDAVDKMRGPVRTTVTLSVVRQGKDAPFDVKLTRETIVLAPVKARLEDGVAYIRLSSFSRDAAEELRTAIRKAQADAGKDAPQGYVLDLRNNPGGLLDQAVEVADVFLDSGEIVSQRGRRPGISHAWRATPGDLTGGKPVIVLVNGGSASASEIVAAALQDHHRATLVGTRSFGKGSVQQIFPIAGSGALKLTIARYYTPSGSSIQAKGVEPDIVVAEDLPSDVAEWERSLKGEAGLRGHLARTGHDVAEESGSSAYIPPDPKDDKQLRYALGLIHGTQVNAAFPPDSSKGVPN